MIYCLGVLDKKRFNSKYSIAVYLLNFFDCLGVKGRVYNYLKSKVCYAKLKLEQNIQKRNGLSSADFDDIFLVYNDIYGFDLKIKTSCISDGVFEIECKK